MDKHEKELVKDLRAQIKELKLQLELRDDEVNRVYSWLHEAEDEVEKLQHRLYELGE